MESETENPFASPSVELAGAIPDFDPDSQIAEFSLGKSMVKWLLVCCVSASPSFFWGIGLHTSYFVQSVAMLMGIFTFVAIYVFVESQEWTRRKLMDRSLRTAVKVGYITRIGISVIFPVALFIDMFCGLFSVGLTSSIFGEEFMPGRRYDEAQPVSMSITFAWFYATTIVQGVILNALLAAYSLLVYAMILLYRSIERQKRAH